MPGITVSDLLPREYSGVGIEAGRKFHLGRRKSRVGEEELLLLQRSGSENGCRSRRLAADCRVVASEPRGVGISFAGEDGAQK